MTSITLHKLRMGCAYVLLSTGSLSFSHALAHPMNKDGIRVNPPIQFSHSI